MVTRGMNSNSHSLLVIVITVGPNRCCRTARPFREGGAIVVEYFVLGEHSAEIGSIRRRKCGHRRVPVVAGVAYVHRWHPGVARLLRNRKRYPILATNANAPGVPWLCVECLSFVTSFILVRGSCISCFLFGVAEISHRTS